MLANVHLLGPVEATSLPATLRRLLKAQCDGDWSRVVVDDVGGHTVYNNPTMALRAIKPPAVEPAPPPSRREKSPEASALQELIGSQAASLTQRPAPKPAPPKVVASPQQQPEPQYAMSPGIWSADPTEVDWNAIHLDSALGKLQEGLRHGLPRHIPFKYLPDVLALHGVDFDAVEAALRSPERVNIRPETAKKKYPVLAFQRGDITAILGLREPTTPMVIAAYALSRLTPDPTSHHTTTGGGKQKQSGSNPTSVNAMLRAFRAMGVEYLLDDPAATCVELKYKGQCLGKVTVGTSPKMTIMSDYQRVVRRVHGIDARAS